MGNNLFTILADIRERIVGLETKFETMGDSNNKATQAILELNALKVRVDKLERIVAWVATTIIGTVIISIMAVVLI